MTQPQKYKKNNPPPEENKCESPLQLSEQQMKLQSLARNMFKLQEEKCKWFSRELHDELGQWLTAVSAEAEVIVNDKNVNSGIKDGAKSIKYSVGKMHEVIHTLMHELRPVLLDTLGLEDSLHELEDKWQSHNPGISCIFKLEGELNKFDEMININVYRIIQESLNNISKHAEATKVRLLLSQRLDALTGKSFLFLNIEDNGKGYNFESSSDGFGVLGMRERIIAVGGEFNIYSTPGDGTQIHIKISLNKSDVS